MGNNLNELEDEVRQQGRDVNVIAKSITVSKDISLNLLVLGVYILGLLLIGLGIYWDNISIIPIGIILIGYMFVSIKKKESYFLQLEQKIQQSASQIDNYLEQRVVVLENTAKLVERAIDLDKTVFSEVAKLRSGNNHMDRNEKQINIDKIYRGLNVAVENYPDLKSHREIEDAMQQNLYLQREITAAREVYNDTIGIWNREIFEWPLKKYVASKKGYSTRIPFATSREMKEKARGVFF